MKQLSTFFLRCQFLASERHNLHDAHCLIDPPVVSFDRESLLKVLLYSSDEFNDKINKKIFLCIIPNKADDTGGRASGAWFPTFLCSKNKKGKQRENRKSVKAETIKRLSPRSKCYCFSNVYCFILERLEFKYFSVFHDHSNLKSISLALPNLALMCAAFHRKLLKSKVQVEWYFLIRFTTSNDLVF